MGIAILGIMLLAPKLKHLKIFLLIDDAHKSSALNFDADAIHTPQLKEMKNHTCKVLQIDNRRAQV